MNANNPFLSVIIPVYNGEFVIEVAINSVLRQGITDYEMIIVNDGSTDGTQSVIEKYKANNCKIIVTENRGLSEARNCGMKYAKGDYVTFLDADDSLVANAYSEIYEILKEGHEVVYINSESCFGDGRVERIAYPVESGKAYAGDEILEASRNRFIQHEAWRGIYKREFLEKNDISFISGLYYEDNTFWLDVMRKGRDIVYLNQYFYHYNVTEGSIMQSPISWEKVRSIYKIIEYYLKCQDGTYGYLQMTLTKAEPLIFNLAKMQTIGSWEEKLEKYSEEIMELKRTCLRYLDTERLEYEYLLPTYLLYEKIAASFGDCTEDMLKKIRVLHELAFSAISLKLSDWKLNDSDKDIAFYGSGRAADNIIWLYEQLHGKIERSYSFIDTYRSGGYHLGHEIRKVDELDKKKKSFIVIASNLYSQSMYNELEKRGLSKNAIRFYDEKTACLDSLTKNNFCAFMDKFDKTENCSRLILLGTPEYQNIGDHLIAVAEKQFFETAFPKLTVVEVTNQEYALYALTLKRLIKKEDYLVITGGGFLGTLWREGHYDEVLDVLGTFRDNRVFIMPQSMFFENGPIGDEYRLRTKSAFERSKIRMCLREQKSYARAKELISADKLMLCPDIAFYYTFEGNREKRRGKKLGYFIREDKESALKISEKNRLREKFIEMGYEVIPSSMQNSQEILQNQRETIVRDKLKDISDYDLIVTDQLHCMISCAITGTPCIALDNISGKLSGVREMIGESGNICLVESIDEISTAIAEKVIGLAGHRIEGLDWDRLKRFMCFE